MQSEENIRKELAFWKEVKRKAIMGDSKEYAEAVRAVQILEWVLR